MDVVFNESPVELESFMFEVVGSESSFDLTWRGRFADSSKDMLDALLLTVCVGA